MRVNGRRAFTLRLQIRSALIEPGLNITLLMSIFTPSRTTFAQPGRPRSRPLTRGRAAPLSASSPAARAFGLRKASSQIADCAQITVPKLQAPPKVTKAGVKRSYHQKQNIVRTKARLDRQNPEPAASYQFGEEAPSMEASTNLSANAAAVNTFGDTQQYMYVFLVPSNTYALVPIMPGTTMLPVNPTSAPPQSLAEANAVSYSGPMSDLEPKEEKAIDEECTPSHAPSREVPLMTANACVTAPASQPVTQPPTPMFYTFQNCMPSVLYKPATAVASTPTTMQGVMPPPADPNNNANDSWVLPVDYLASVQPVSAMRLNWPGTPINAYMAAVATPLSALFREVVPDFLEYGEEAAASTAADKAEDPVKSSVESYAKAVATAQGSGNEMQSQGSDNDSRIDSKHALPFSQAELCQEKDPHLGFVKNESDDNSDSDDEYNAALCSGKIDTRRMIWAKRLASDFGGRLRFLPGGGTICTECNIKFKLSKHARRHARIMHQQYTRPQCPFCQNSFARQDTLKRHMTRCKARRQKDIEKTEI